MSRIVVVGAGLAGFQSTVALRARGYEGELFLVGGEPHQPYDRPPLSKAILLGKSDDSALPFDPGMLRVEVRLGVSATGLRPGVVETDAGDLDYDGLVLATGSEPIRLPGTGARYLRTRDDALALRSSLQEGARVLIVGAGWIGAEVTTAAVRHGCRVTVVEAADAPVAQALPAEVGTWMVPWYAEAGAELLCGERVAAVASDGVTLTDGRVFPADVVVVGVGVRPATRWLGDPSAVELDAGVLVDERLRTSMPNVVAVGDVAARWSPRYGTRIRGEHWDDATRAPGVAATNLVAELAGSAGADEPVQVYDPVPYVWSEQFGRMVQYAGHHPAGDRLIWRGDPAGAAWAAYWLDGSSRLVAALAVDRPRDFVPARKLAASGAVVDADALADPDIPVRDTVLASNGETLGR